MRRILNVVVGTGFLGLVLLFLFYRVSRVGVRVYFELFSSGVFFVLRFWRVFLNYRYKIEELKLNFIVGMIFRVVDY